MKRGLLAALLVLPLLGSDSPKEYDDATKYVGIEGTWQRTEMEWNGEKVIPSAKIVLNFLDGNYTENHGDGDTFRGRYRIDPTHKPPYLDQINVSDRGKDDISLRIYQLNDDTLKIAFFFNSASKVAPRPQGFNSIGVFILTYKRVK